METAAKILIVGGVGNLLLGLVTGALMVRVRTSSSGVPKYLTGAHLGALIWAPILLGLVWAVRLSDMASWVETLAAALLVGSSVAVGARDLLYWTQGVHDEFVERPPAFVLGPIGAVASVIGAAIFLIGALRAL
jgi:hypothetical protein